MSLHDSLCICDSVLQLCFASLSRCIEFTPHVVWIKRGLQIVTIGFMYRSEKLSEPHGCTLP